MTKTSVCEEALLIPAGTRPADVATLLGAIQEEFAPAAGLPRPGRLIVPLAPDQDPDEARAILRERLALPLSEQVAVILQTSGSTTGRGHLVGLSRLALTASAHATAAALKGPGRWILALPAHHVAGFQILVRSVLGGNVPIVVDTSRGFDVAALARAARRACAGAEPAYTSIVPAQLRRILGAGADDQRALAQLDAILVGGQACDPHMLAEGRRLGLRLVTTYGMTETGGGCVYDGVPLSGVKVAAIEGRIWISGTTLMDGYVDAPEDSPIITSGGRRWLRTSDRGRMAGARLEVTGRLDSVIITGGVKVHPGVVEECLRTLPGIEDVCVVGVPHHAWGHVVTAVFVPSADADPGELAAMRRRAGLLGDDDQPDAVVATSPALKEAVAAMAAAIRGGEGEEESPTTVFAQLAPGPRQEEGDRDIALKMRAHVAAELGRTQAPRIVCMVDSLPQLGIGKVDRKRVAQIAQEEIAAKRAWMR